ncbi:MAG: hypothetical protein LBL99_00090 [Holosporaceae bacterium]|jgi:hypothetical protein|nr:hypothetical protein [Holosporaceae bacterium]
MSEIIRLKEFLLEKAKKEKVAAKRSKPRSFKHKKTLESRLIEKKKNGRQKI